MDTNQTNIEQADEIAGYLANVGILTGKTTAPYINFFLVPYLPIWNAYCKL